MAEKSATASCIHCSNLDGIPRMSSVQFRKFLNMPRLESHRIYFRNFQEISKIQEMSQKDGAPRDGTDPRDNQDPPDNKAPRDNNDPGSPPSSPILNGAHVAKTRRHS